MGTLLLNQLKRQTTSFLQDKYRIARMTFTDVTEAELLAEEATNNDPSCNPDAKTMTLIALASFDVDDYWRIVDIIHRRLYNFDSEEWRQSYKALILLEFLLTHGRDGFAQEFQCDAHIIEELGSFTHIDERGFNWGARMQSKSNQILKLLESGETLKAARLKALKITKEIQGFGSTNPSPSSSSQSPSSSEAFSPTFCPSSSITKPTYDQLNKSYSEEVGNDQINTADYNEELGNHVWDGLVDDEKDNLLESDDENNNKPKGFVTEMCSKLIGNGSSTENHEKYKFRCVSDVGKEKDTKKRFDRQNSLWY